MVIKNIQIKNYRLLHGISVNLEDDITLIVGKNNTGKTSFFEVIQTLLTTDGKISFEDFSHECFGSFREALSIYIESLSETDELAKEELEKKVILTVPKIELQVTIEYDKNKDSLIELSEFITDLDPERNDATILATFEPKNTLALFAAFQKREDKEETLFKFLQANIAQHYRSLCYALDPTNGLRREIEGNFRDKVKKIVSFEDIKALRILDDKKGDRNNTLALGFAKYYQERDKTKEDVLALEKVLKEIGADLKLKYKKILEKILLDLKNFGAHTPIVIPDITIDSIFDSEAVIKDNIKYFYRHDELDLPESYNGLGYSNLIYMVLEFASFIEKFKNSKEEKVSEFLTVLVEEPEAHMHPQMQQVFISQIMGLLNEAKAEKVHIQLVITTHSSHIISEAGIDLQKGFNRIRYFNRTDGSICIQDFNKLDIGDDKRTFRFLKQYLNLHKSDLFFADKVIMVEGVTERLLLPQMITKVAPSLRTEYVTILEVGGAYTHKFKEILEFIKIKTLIITDLDSVGADEIACAVDLAAGQTTSNETLTQWLPGKSSIIDLVSCDEEGKLFDGYIRVAYQIPEPGKTYYPRSFEEAFITCNRDLLNKTVSVPTETGTNDVKIKNEFTQFRTKAEATFPTDTPYDLRPKGSKAKTNFAFDVMTFDEEKFGKWNVPFYIKEGLEWLCGMCILNQPEP
ncbi:MAG: AAA family ATPase [Pedobacter sp.]|nr:AAA family ATPase [Pedobacter sp.]